MGTARIDVTALEHLIKALSTVETELRHRIQDVANAPKVLVGASWYLPVARYSVFYSTPTIDAYLAWRADWEQKLRKALGLAYDMLAANPSLSLYDPVGIDEGDIDAALPALLPEERWLMGEQIGSKLASGLPLTDEEWDYYCRYCNTQDFNFGLWSKATPADLANATADLLAAFKTRLEANGIGNYPALSGLTDEQKRQFQDFRDQVIARMKAMGDSLATWAGVPGNAQTAADQITAALQSQTDPNVPLGMTILLGYGSFNSETALSVAEGMYDWANDPNTHWDSHSLLPGLVDPTNGQYYFDPVSSIPRVLGNNPEAANDFFTGGSSTILNVKGVDVPVDERIAWALGYPWDTDGIDAGIALFAASVPQPGPDGTPGEPSQLQAQVASQVVAGVSWRYQQSKTGGAPFPLGDGLAVGVASIMAAYMADGIEVANTEGVHGDLGHGNPVGDGGYGLGLTSDMFGLAIQALSAADPATAAILAQGWSDHLGDYLGRRWADKYAGMSQSEIDKAIQTFLQNPGGSPEGKWLAMAAEGLDFIGDNACWPYVDSGTETGQDLSKTILSSILTTATGVALGAISVGLGLAWTAAGLAVEVLSDVFGGWSGDNSDESIAAAVTGVSDSASGVWLARLASQGYFTPDSITGWQGDSHYANPFQPDAGGQTAVTQNEDGTYSLDPGSAAAQAWMDATGLGYAGRAMVTTAELRAPVGDNETGPDDNGKKYDKQVTLP